MNGWLLFAVVAAVWFPFDPWWQSDDFLAIHYAQDFGRALSDFWGNQYGLEGLTWFYRPLITLSFATELALAGADPWLAHASNVLAHALNAVLVAMLIARFAGERAGWLGGLVWGLSPLHAAAVWWTVGRVDTHSGVFVFLSLVLAVRAFDRGRPPLLGLIAFALALMTKESALVAAGCALILGYATAEPTARMRGALRAWPYLAVVAAYFVFRYFLFGRALGGYGAARFQLEPALAGRWHNFLNGLSPLRLGGLELVDGPGELIYLGFAPIALGLVALLARRQLLALALGVLWFLGTSVPTAPLWSATTLEVQRYDYIALIAVAALIANGGIAAAMLAIAVTVLPHLSIRLDFQDLWREAAVAHQLLREQVEDTPDETWLVSGLPRASDRYTMVGMFLGVDRLLRPPLVDAEPRTLLALRPIGGNRPNIISIPYGESVAVPFGMPTFLLDDGILARLPEPRLGALELGPGDEIFLPTAEMVALQRGETVRNIQVQGPASAQFRVTIFAARGYTSCLVPNRGDAQNGVVDMRDVMLARFVMDNAADQAHVAFALETPTALDLRTRFPMLIEAGAIDATGFRPTHANRKPFWLRLERSYSRFIGGGD